MSYLDNKKICLLSPNTFLKHTVYQYKSQFKIEVSSYKHDLTRFKYEDVKMRRLLKGGNILTQSNRIGSRICLK